MTTIRKRMNRWFLDLPLVPGFVASRLAGERDQLKRANARLIEMRGLICTGCGGSMHLDDVHEMGKRSCCPERNMVRTCVVLRERDDALRGRGNLLELVHKITVNLGNHRADNVRLRRIVAAFRPYAESVLASRHAAGKGDPHSQVWREDGTAITYGMLRDVVRPEIAPEGAGVTAAELERARFVTIAHEGETYADYCARVWPFNPTPPAADAPDCRNGRGCLDPHWCTDTGACWRTNEWRDGGVKARTAPASDGVA